MKKLITIILALSFMATASAYMVKPSIQDWTENQHKLHSIANIAREMGLPEDSPIIEEASRLWWEEHSTYEQKLRILANVVYNEAKYCADEHQQLVAMVVLNRVRSPLFPNSIIEVVEQPGQYHPAYVHNTPELDDEDTEVQRCIRNAKVALDGFVDCPENVLFQSQFPELGNGYYKVFYVDTGYYQSTTYFAYG